MAAGYLVRTRADSDTVEARSGDTAPRDAAIASGAQYVSTDYPVENPAFGTGYVVRIPNGMPARCNPVNAPATCREEGLERLHARPHPCCVVLDLMMPNMDGFEFRVRQMEDPEVAAIPVIVLSAGGDVERKVAHLGVAAALTKPPDFDRLLACVAGCRSRS